jgi:predicted glycoside hydrolase/deacetylase ChbG (UPF0249 family)
MSAKRFLIINADDFGQSVGVNRGIITAHEQGVVTSSSLMVRWPAAAMAADYARRQPALSLGLHLDLGEWACRDGTWEAVYEVVSLEDPTAVSAEVEHQLSTFRRLVGREPTHIDSHQHAHLQEPVRSAVVKVARKLSIPVRRLSPGVGYCGDFYGQTDDGQPLPEILSVEGLRRILAELPAGFTELGCHPGLDVDLETMYREERTREVEVLCAPEVKALLAELEIELCTFRDIPWDSSLEGHDEVCG